MAAKLDSSDNSQVVSEVKNGEEDTSIEKLWQPEDKNATKTFIKFDNICRQIGAAKYWPGRILGLFWSKTLSDSELLTLCIFVWVNRLEKKEFILWLMTINAFHHHRMVLHVERWFEKFEKECKTVRRLCAYNILNHRYEYIDGRIREQLGPNETPSYFG
jgi:hypothetical protein